MINSSYLKRLSIRWILTSKSIQWIVTSDCAVINKTAEWHTGLGGPSGRRKQQKAKESTVISSTRCEIHNTTNLLTTLTLLMKPRNRSH